jgi:cytidylate kinase
MDNLIVTIDGPAGVGKSTIAKRVAGALEIAYLDTGAMFRSVAWKLGEGAWEMAEPDLREALQGLGFQLHGQGELSGLILNGEFLGKEIRTEQVGMWGSNMAKLPVVREYLKAAQQDIGTEFSLVAEGRDMGSVIFPDAPHKFFLDATVEERANRRYLQLKAMSKEADLAEITSAIAARDDQDRNRAIAPLKPAADAVIIDTTDLDQDQVFATVMGHIKASPANLSM